MVKRKVENSSYSTCTINKGENEEVVHNFYPEFELQPIRVWLYKENPILTVHRMNIIQIRIFHLENGRNKLQTGGKIWNGHDVGQDML